MAVETGYPGVYVEETSTGIHPIESVSTSTAAFVGPARAGPIDGPQTCAAAIRYCEQRGALFIADPSVAWKSAGQAIAGLDAAFPMRSFARSGPVVWGARTFAGAAASEWKHPHPTPRLLHRAERPARHPLGRVRTQCRADLGEDPAERRRFHGQDFPQRRSSGTYRARGVLREVRCRDDEPERHRCRHSQRADRLRAAEAGGIRDHHDPPAIREKKKP